MPDSNIRGTNARLDLRSEVNRREVTQDMHFAVGNCGRDSVETEARDFSGSFPAKLFSY
jgi:hypothetical protein